MNFIKSVFKFIFLLFLTIIGIGVLFTGLETSNYILIGVGVLFLLPFLIIFFRKIFSKKQNKSQNTDLKKESKESDTVKKSGFFSKAFGSYDFQKVMENYFSISEITIKNLTDEEYIKLLGKNTTVIKKDIFLFPLSHEVKIKTTFSYEGMAGVFDVKKWNHEMGLHNNALKENRRLRERYDDHMVQYEGQLQTYQLQEQTRRQTIGNAAKGQKGTAFLLTSGARKPKKPSLRLLKVPPAPQNKDDYTVFTDKKTGTNVGWGDNNPLNLVFHSRALESFDNFNNSYVINEYPDTFKSIVNSFMKIYSDQIPTYVNQLTKHEISLKTDENIETKKIIISESDLLNKDNKDKEVNFKELSLWDKHISDSLKVFLMDNISEGKLVKDVRMKDVTLDVSKISYQLNDRKFLPLQIIEFNDKKGNKKIEVLDFIKNKLVKL